MRRVVVDASALLEYLFGTPRAAAVGATMRADDVDLHVPALCDIEVMAGLRRALAERALDLGRAEEVVDDYLDLPLVRHGHQRLLPRLLTLRSNFSAYDATYVALAEELGATLLTADMRLARAAQRHTELAIVAT